MATANPVYNPALFGAIGPPVTMTPPVTIDGTGLTTTVPLTIKNGKSLSGIDLQVTGTAATGYRLLDSSGTQQGVFGFAVSAGEWGSASAAGDIVIAWNLAKKLVFGRTGSTTIMTIDPNNGGTFMASGHKFGIDSSNSLTSVALQISGDINSGVAQIGGADTVSMVCGGVEALRMDATGKATFGLASIALGGGAPPTVGTIGGSGPAAAAQNKWGKVNFAGTDYFIPLWV